MWRCGGECGREGTDRLPLVGRGSRLRGRRDLARRPLRCDHVLDAVQGRSELLRRVGRIRSGGRRDRGARPPAPPARSDDRHRVQDGGRVAQLAPRCSRLFREEEEGRGAQRRQNRPQRQQGQGSERAPRQRHLASRAPARSVGRSAHEPNRAARRDPTPARPHPPPTLEGSPGARRSLGSRELCAPPEVEIGSVLLEGPIEAA